MSQSIICDRALDFACRILKLSERMWDRGPAARHIAAQLIRCSTSIGANAEEAQEAQTKPDFITKQSISRKEAREARYWLRLAIRVRAVTADEVKWELSEVNQLLAMIISSIRTARSSTYRGENT